MNPKLAELQAMITGAQQTFQHSNKQLTEALRAIQWRLRGPNGEYVGLRNLSCSFVPESEALIFDGRDNEERKLDTYEAALGSLTIEIIPQILTA